MLLALLQLQMQIVVAGQGYFTGWQIHMLCWQSTKLFFFIFEGHSDFILGVLLTPIKYNTYACTAGESSDKMKNSSTEYVLGVHILECSERAVWALDA